MKVAVDKKCIKCCKNDPVHHDVSSWDDVKQLLVVDEKWQCPNCGCRAAYWYFYRESYLESHATLADLKEAENQSSWQLFGFTGDPALNITQSPAFEVKLRDPTDWSKELTWLK